MRITWVHADHGLTDTHKQIAEVLLVSREPGFHIVTVDVSNVGWLDNALYGPACGDDPVDESLVFYTKRTPDRPGSRMIHKSFRKSRQMTTIGSVSAPIVEGGEKSIVIFTCHGGPAAERSPFDKSLVTDKEMVDSLRFWRDHALACGGCKDCPDAEVL